MVGSMHIMYNYKTKTHDSSFILNDENIFNNITNIKPYKFRLFGSEIFNYFDDKTLMTIYALGSDCSMQFVDMYEVDYKMYDSNWVQVDEFNTIFDTKVQYPNMKIFDNSHGELKLSDCECLENSKALEEIENSNIGGIERSEGGLVTISPELEEEFKKTSDIYNNRNDFLDPVPTSWYTREKTSYVVINIKVNLKDGTTYHEYREYDINNMIR